MQHFIHLTDLVDEQDAAMRVCYKPRLRLGHAAVCKTLLCPLIDGVVHRAKQRVRHVARVPAQRRSVRLHERRILRERRCRTLLRCLKHEACRRRLAHARRPIEKEVLRIGRGELCHKRTHSTLLTDHLIEAARAQELHDRLGEMDAFQCLQILALLLIVR